MTDPALEISQEAPTNSEGHPIHPERGHRICAGTKSDRTTPTKHGRERDEYDYCLLAAGWGVDGKSTGPCRHHFGAVDNRGENNPSYRHGAYSKHMMDDLTEEERAAFDDLVDALGDPKDALGTIRELAAEALLKYKRSGDFRFLREYRQLADTFNLAPNEDEMNVNLSGEVGVEHDVPDHVVKAIIGASEANLGGGDAS